MYWNCVRERFFHGLSKTMRTNPRTQFDSGANYYKLLELTRMIESENFHEDSKPEVKSTNQKGEAKVGAVTVDNTAQQIQQLQGAVKGLTKLLQGNKQNTQPQPEQAAHKVANGLSKVRLEMTGGKANREQILLFPKRKTAEKSTEEVPVDSPNETTPLKEQLKEMLNLSKNSDETKDTKHTFIPTPTVRNGFRRKKGDNPLVYNLNLKVKKEKKQSSFTNPDPWARIVGSRNTAAIYINGKVTTALYDSGAELQLISKEYCDTNNLEIQPIEKLVDCENMNGGLFGYDGIC